MLRNRSQALGLILALAIPALLFSSSLAASSDAKLTRGERCAIAKIKATQRAGKCLAHGLIKGIRKSLSEEEVNSITERCETRHARAFARAEGNAQNRGERCAADGNASGTHNLVAKALRDAAYGDVETSLNDQFNKGDTKASYLSLSDAGVLLHQWDGSNETAPQWIPTPGHGGHSVLAISSSITNTKLRTKTGYTGIYTVHVPYPPSGGLIFSTEPVEKEKVQIGCMGAGDIGSDVRLNGGCGCRNEPVCKPYYNLDLYPKTPKTSVTIDASSNLCQNSNGGNYMQNPDVEYWTKCNPSNFTPSTFGVGSCVAKPTGSDSSDWYLSGEQVSGSSQLKAIMESTAASCFAHGQGSCYNEVMVRTTSFYHSVPSEPQSSPIDVGDPKSGAIVAFFYLNVADGHYPPTNPASPSGNWAPTDAGGQCDTYKRWKAFRSDYTSERTVLVEFDLSAEESPFSTVCTNPDDDCKQKQVAAGCPTDD